MKALAASKARANFYRLIDETAQTRRPIRIIGKRGSAVLVSADDWRAIQETLHLCAIPGMVKSVKRGMAEPLPKSRAKATTSPPPPAAPDALDAR